MKFSQLEWELLSDVSEDTYGFEELLVTARTLHATQGEDELLSMTRDAVERLLREGLVYVCWFQHTTNIEKVIAIEEAGKLLRDDSSWVAVEPGMGRPYPAAHATEVGKRTWHAGPSDV